MDNDIDESGEPDSTGSTRFTEEQALKAQEALTHRPRISIRLRIAAGFLVTFVFTCSITIAAMVFISNIGNRLSVLEKAGNFEFEIQQARRFEKNWFLYGTNLYDALNNAQTAENLLDESPEDMKTIIGDDAFATMKQTLIGYRETLEDLGSMLDEDDSTTAARRLALESRLRQYGSEIVAQASNVVDQERLRIHTWLKTSMVIAVAALVVVLGFVAFIASFITRQIIRPFGRFERYTRRIAAGDFSLITPARKYRDEFTNLAIALNHMLIELKRHEDQLIQSRKMAAVGNLTAGIAHELNNPLNNISLTTEALVDEFDDWNREEKLKMLGTISDQVERASVTVANLLDFTRRDQSAFEQLNINDVITRTAKLLSNEISLNKVTLDLRLGDNLPRLFGNAHDLQQVFLNLFVNAIQAMPGGGTLRVTSLKQVGAVRIEVADSGIGIPAEARDKIFDPFFTTKEVGKGTGLGLSVSYGIIRKHHGRVSVTSEVGQGTTFVVELSLDGRELPVEQDTDSAATHNERREP